MLTQETSVLPGRLSTSGPASTSIKQHSPSLPARPSVSPIWSSSKALSGGGGNLAVTGSMSWNGGTISGFGALTIDAGAVLGLSSGEVVTTETLSGVNLQNAGAVSLVGNSANGLQLKNGAQVVNAAGASFTILTRGSITSDGTATTFINEGSLIDSASSIGQTTIDPSFTQTSSGTTMVIVNSLRLAGGGSPVSNDGSVTVESGGTLAIATDYDQIGGATTLANGTFSGGNVDIQGGAGWHGRG